MPSVDDLIRDLRSEGEVVSEGHFTLDREKAREKMRQFQLADPRSYVLELVQAAVLKGASRIVFDIDADDMIMRCDGRPFDGEDFRELYSSMFIGGDDGDLRARRELALGMNAAMALNPRYIRIESGDARIELRPGKEDQVSDGTTVEETRIHVKDRFRPGLVAQFFRNVSGRLAEELYLHTRCRHSRVQVTLDGASISEGLSLPDGFGLVDIKADGIIGVAGFVFGSDPKLRLIKDGVWITTHPLKKVLPCFCAVIEGGHLRKDVSQANIVGDSAYQAVIGVVRKAQSVAVKALYDQLPTLDASRNAWATYQIKTSIMRSKKLERLKGDPNLWEAAALPLWTDARGMSEVLTLQQLVETAEARGSFRYSTKYFPTLEPDARAPIPHLIDPEDVKGLCQLFEDDKNVTRALANQVKRQENEARFRKRTMVAALGDKAMVARARIAGRNTAGEVGVTSVSAQDSRLYLIKEGCLLIGRVVQLPVTGLEIAVESDFQPTKGWDDARHTQAYGWALLQVCAALPELANNIAAVLLGGRGGVHPTVRDNYRRWLLRYLAFATGDKPGAEFLKACGFSGKSSRRYAREMDDNHVLLPKLGVGRLPAPDPKAPLDSIANVPLFSTTAGAVVSLRDLQQEVARNQDIAYVGDSLPPGIESRRDLVLRVGHDEWPVLENAFYDQLRNYEAAYRQAMAAEQFLRKTEEGVVLPIPGLLHVDVSTADGITGSVGLYDRGVEQVQKPRANLRLLKQHRFLADHEMRLPFGNVSAIINYDGLLPNAQWDGVGRDEALRKVEQAVRRATNELVQQLASEYAHQPRSTYTRSLLVEVTATVLGGGSWKVPNPELLRDLPLFATIAGEAVSVRAVEAEKAAHGEVLFLERAPEERVDARMILILDDLEAAALSRIFGPAALCEASTWMSRWRKERALAALPRVDELLLAHSESLVTVPLTAIEGEIGLRNALGQDTPDSVVTVCKDRRRVGEHKFRAPVALIAIVDDAEVAITESGDLAPDAPRRASIEAACLAEIPSLIGDLVDAWPELDNARRRVAWRHLLDFCAFAFENGTETGPLRHAYERAAAVSNFPGADDKLYSLTDLLEAEKAVGEVNYVRTHVRGEPLDARRVVLAPRPYELLRLESIVEHLVRYDDEWAEEQGGRRRRDRADPLTQSPPDVVAEVEYARKGMQAHLWLPRLWSGNLTVEMGQDGKLIEKRRVSDLFPCAGVVTGPGLDVSRTWVTVVLARWQKSWLQRKAFRLYAHLETRLRRKQTESIDERAAAIAYLGRAVLALHRAIEVDEKLEKNFRKLYDRLLSQPLLKLQSGRFVSLERALEERPAALEYLSLWEPPAGAEAAPIHLALPRETPLPAKDEPPELEPSPRPRETTIEERFVDAVCEELRWSRRRDSQLISDRLLARVRLIDGKNPHVIANAAHDQVLIYRNHPVVSWALAELDNERVPLAVVVSAVYTAINRALKEIRDEDERQFQAVLARGLLSPEQNP